MDYKGEEKDLRVEVGTTEAIIGDSSICVGEESAVGVVCRMICSSGTGNTFIAVFENGRRVTTFWENYFVVVRMFEIWRYLQVNSM
jgi:hypothetical protein